MANQVTIQFQADRTLREDCDKIFASMGIDLNTALKMFMERARQERGLPFPVAPPLNHNHHMTQAEARAAIESARKEAESAPEMSLEEINAEIRAARLERKVGN